MWRFVPYVYIFSIPNYKHFIGLNSSNQFIKMVSKRQIKKIYKSHNLPYKECKVILESQDLTQLKQAQKICQSNLHSAKVNSLSTFKDKVLIVPLRNENPLVISKNRVLTVPLCKENLPLIPKEKVLTVPLKRENLHRIPKDKVLTVPLTNLQIKVGSDEQVSEKQPIYRQIFEDGSKDDQDLYEFDDFDADKLGESKKLLNKKRKKAIATAQLKKRKRNLNKGATKKIKKDTYDVIVQQIVQKVMKKVDKNKLEENNEPALIQKETCAEPKADEKNVIQDNILVDNKHNEDVNENTLHDNEYFDDGEDNESNCEFNQNNNIVKSSARINIISDITLDEDDGFSFFEKHIQTDANSTILSRRKYAPWRFRQDLIRNPHYLTIKSNGLPCLQQDMVIDYKQLEKFEERAAKPRKRIGNVKKTRIGLLELEINNKENNPRLSNLFDYDDFIITQPKLLENITKAKPKRNILGPKVLNDANIMKQDKIISSLTILESLEVEISTNNDKFEENLKEPPQNTFMDSSVKSYDLKLFEDEEPSVNFNEDSKIYIPKVRKKRKLLYENAEEPKEERHKNEMTRSEQVAMERWAAKFNSLCEDIEKHKLEIE